MNGVADKGRSAALSLMALAVLGILAILILPVPPEARAAALATGGRPAVVLAPPDLRKPLFDFASRFVPDLWVVSARELVPGTLVEPAGLVHLSQPGGV